MDSKRVRIIIKIKVINQPRTDTHAHTREYRKSFCCKLLFCITRYGSCGQRCDRRSPRKPLCWVDVLSRNYSFYLAMENNVCNEYVTEKLYNPLVYNLVPVVWGGEYQLARWQRRRSRRSSRLILCGSEQARAVSCAWHRPHVILSS